MREFVAIACAKGILPAAVDAAELARFVRVWQANSTAMEQYRPVPIDWSALAANTLASVPPPMVYFKAETRRQSDHTTEPEAGWKQARQWTAFRDHFSQFVCAGSSDSALCFVLLCSCVRLGFDCQRLCLLRQRLSFVLYVNPVRTYVLALRMCVCVPVCESLCVLRVRVCIRWWARTYCKSAQCLATTSRSTTVRTCWWLPVSCWRRCVEGALDSWVRDADVQCRVRICMMHVLLESRCESGSGVAAIACNSSTVFRIGKYWP